MARYSIFTQFNEDDDDEGKKPSQIASEEQKKKRYEIFSQFNEPFVAPKRPEKKPEPEPVEEKKFLEKAKEKTKTFFGKAKEFAGKAFEKVKQWDPAYEVQKGVFGEEAKVADEYVDHIGEIRQFREQAVRQLEEAEQARREYYGKGPKQINTAVEKRVHAAKWQIEDYDQILGDERANRGFFVELFKSIQKGGLTPDYYESFIATKQGEAVLKYKNGEELTSEEQMYVNSFRAKSYNALIDKGMAPMVAEVTAGIPRYAMLIGATSAVVDPFTASAQMAVLSKIPPGLAQTVVNKILGNSIKLAIASNLNFPGIEAKTAEYMLPIVDYERALETDDILSYLKPGDAPMEAYRKAYLTNLVEYVSEGMGGYLDDAMPFFKKAVVGKWLADKGLDATNPTIIKKVLEASNFNSLLSEVFEEEIAEPIQAYIEGREYNDPLFTPEGRERLIVETLGIFAFSGMSKVSDSVINKATTRRGSNNDVISIPVDATADVVPPGEREEQELPPEIEEELAPKESKEAVEDLRKYMLTEKSLIPEKTIDKLKEMKIGVSEMEFDDDGMITLYREGEITPGKPNSFSLSKKANQKEYQISKDDILINTTSGELADLFSKTYEGREKDLYLETLEKWNTLEAEVIAIPSDVAEGGLSDIKYKRTDNARELIDRGFAKELSNDPQYLQELRVNLLDRIRSYDTTGGPGITKGKHLTATGHELQNLKDALDNVIKKQTELSDVAQPPITDIPKELEPMAQRARIAEDEADFLASEVFDRSTPGTIKKFIDEKYTGKNFDDRLASFYQQVTAKKAPKKKVAKKPVKPKGVKVKVEPKVVKVPREQLPVGEGIEKVSRLGARVEGALDRTSKEEIEALGLSTYRQLSNKENIAKANIFVVNNPNEALAVIRGDVPPPSGLLKNSVYVALKNLGAEDTDVATKIASLASTRMGQEISILREVEIDSPVTLMEDIVIARIEGYEKRTGKKVSEQITKEVEKINEATKTIKKDVWAEFINSLEC